MKTEPDEYPEDNADDWYRHPGTIARAKNWMQRQHELQQALHRACSGSSDPIVRGAYAEYQSAVMAVATLVPQKKEPNGKR